jgi:hypothetical protein
MPLFLLIERGGYGRRRGDNRGTILNQLGTTEIN